MIYYLVSRKWKSSSQTVLYRQIRRIIRRTQSRPLPKMGTSLSIFCHLPSICLHYLELVLLVLFSYCVISICIIYKQSSILFMKASLFIQVLKWDFLDAETHWRLILTQFYVRTNLFHINISINLLKNIKREVKIHALLIFVLANVIFMKKARV